VDLSIVLSSYNRADAEKLFPKRIKIVSNGIPDPFPDFDRTLLVRRKARLAARKKILAQQPLTALESEAAGSDPNIFRVLYLAHCTHDKGLFDAIDSVVLANKKLVASNSPISIRLVIAGNFVDKTEKVAFDALLEDSAIANVVRYVGFAAAERKTQALCDADALCFPTFYSNENQPVNLIEAMAFGLPIVTTRWRSLPEMFPPGYPALVEPHQPLHMCDTLLCLASGDLLPDGHQILRQHFLNHFTVECHLDQLASAIRSVESGAPPSERPVPAR
jgi:glycosyltransferase involved in cell wall biosynthesis